MVDVWTALFANILVLKYNQKYRFDHYRVELYFNYTLTDAVTASFCVFRRVLVYKRIAIS